MNINNLCLSEISDILYHLNSILSIVESESMTTLKEEVAERVSLLSNLMPSKKKAIEAGIKVTEINEIYSKYEGEAIIIEGSLKWKAVGMPENTMYSTADMHFNSTSYIEFYPLNF